MTGILVGLAGGSEVRVGDGMVDLRPHRCSIPSPKPIKSSSKPIAFVSFFDRFLSSLLVDNGIVYTLQPHRIGHNIAHVRHRVAGGARQDAS